MEYCPCVFVVPGSTDALQRRRSLRGDQARPDEPGRDQLVLQADRPRRDLPALDGRCAPRHQGAPSLWSARLTPQPENLLIDAQGMVKITDFGVSDVFRMCWEKTTHLSKGLCGSEPYIAPEQFEQKEYDARLVDVWAVAIVFYCLSASARRHGPTDAPRSAGAAVAVRSVVRRVVPGLRAVVQRLTLAAAAAGLVAARVSRRRQAHARSVDQDASQLRWRRQGASRVCLARR